MEEENNKLIIPNKFISKKIYMIRKRKVMLDQDLAELYGVTTGNLNKSVKRNIMRFPEDFMFQLTKVEFENLLFHIGIARWGGRRLPPYAFTEHGVAMLSGVLHSKRAITVNIKIMRVFTHLREMLETHKEILKKLENIQRKDIEQDEKIILIFEYIKQLEKKNLEELKYKNRTKMGYRIAKVK